MYYNSEQVEIRCSPTAELRAEGNEKEPKFVGYASVFGQYTDIGGIFKEKVRKGAFTKTIKEADVRGLLNHDPNYVIGRNKVGTLRLWEDDKGLGYELLPPPTSWANDLYVSVKRGDISQSSFGFSVNKSEDDYENDTRELIDVTLYDISLVTFPAYPTTSAQVRSAFQKKQPSPPPASNQWEDIDRIINKIKGGEELADEEIRVLTVYIPQLSVPPAKHTETLLEPPAKHSISDPRRGDKWTRLWLKEPIKTNP